MGIGVSKAGKGTFFLNGFRHSGQLGAGLTPEGDNHLVAVLQVLEYLAGAGLELADGVGGHGIYSSGDC